MNLDELRIVTTTIFRNENPFVNFVVEQFAAMLHVASIKHFKRKTGITEEYLPGQTISSVGPEISKHVLVDLLPFQKHIGAEGEGQLPIDSRGYALYPTDFYYPLSLMYRLSVDGNVEYRNIEIVSDKAYADAMSSKIITPTKLFPIMNMRFEYMRFAPQNLQFAEMTYLSLPVKPVYAIDNYEGVIVYNHAASTQLQWDEINQIDILAILLSDLGVSIRREDIVQISEKVKSKGI